VLRRLGGIAVLVLVVALGIMPSASAGAAQGPGPPKYVMIRSYRFDPDPVEVTAGTAITWMNLDRARHDVTATDPAVFASPELSLGDEWTITLDRPGTITYTCSIHPDMRGAIRVLPAAAPALPAVAVVTTPASLAATGAATAAVVPAPAPASPSLRPLAVVTAFVLASTVGSLLALRRRA